jgi:Skp family chaperone for outer membrane proteins
MNHGNTQLHRAARYRRKIAAVCLVLCATVAITLQAQNESTARPTAVAIVDVQRVWDMMDQRKAVDADLVRMKENMDMEFAAKSNEINEQERELRVVLNPTQPGYAEAEEQLIRELAYFKAWQELQQRKFERERIIRMEDTFNKIIQAVSREAQTAGYNLVLQDDRGQAPRGKTQQELTGSMTIRKVLFASDAVDLTDHVIQVLNNEFNNQ